MCDAGNSITSCTIKSVNNNQERAKRTCSGEAYVKYSVSCIII